MAAQLQHGGRSLWLVLILMSAHRSWSHARVWDAEELPRLLHDQSSLSDGTEDSSVTTSGCSAKAEPRIYVYDALPAEFTTPPNLKRNAKELYARIRASDHFETNGSCADYFLLRHYSAQDKGKAVRMFEHIAAAYPWWNATRNRTRHLLYLPHDHGPGDAVYGLPISRGQEPLSSLRVNPYSYERDVGFLVLNGVDDRLKGGQVRSRCRSCFAPGVDIRLPTPPGHVCGPLCGGTTLEQLRSLSPWARPPAERAAALQRTRRVRFYWAGSVRRRRSARDQLVRYHGNRTGWVVRATPKPERRADGTRVRAGKANGVPPLAATMADADFCGSPVGMYDGDSDRYLPAMLYGCVPVFFHAREARPFDEVLEWANFSVVLGEEEVPELHRRLQAITQAETVRMRTAIGEVVERMLYTTFLRARRGSRERALLREDGQSDAFSGLIDVLRSRLQAAPAAHTGTVEAPSLATRGRGVSDTIRARPTVQHPSILAPERERGRAPPSIDG